MGRSRLTRALLWATRSWDPQAVMVPSAPPGTAVTVPRNVLTPLPQGPIPDLHEEQEP